MHKSEEKGELVTEFEKLIFWGFRVSLWERGVVVLNSIFICYTHILKLWFLCGDPFISDRMGMSEKFFCCSGEKESTGTRQDMWKAR